MPFIVCFFIILCNVSLMSAQTDHDVLVFDKFSEMETRLTTNSDTTYVVNFWATWCKPCVKELPYFEQLHNDGHQDLPLKVILVSLDDKRKLESKVLPLLSQKNIQSEVWLLDDTKYNDWIDKVSTSWSGAIPATLIFDRQRRLFEESDFDSYDQLRYFIDQFIKS